MILIAFFATRIALLCVMMVSITVLDNDSQKGVPLTVTSTLHCKGWRICTEFVTIWLSR